MPYSYDPDAAGLIPEGVHQLTVTSIDETSSRNGDPMWVIRLEDTQHRELTEWIVQTPRIIDWKFRPLWEAAGLDWPRQATIIDEQELIDKQVQATITHEETAQFGRQPRIQGYTRVGEGDLPDGQEAFPVGDQRQPTPAGAQYGQDPDDEIPF
jgi:hypothetical protein